MKNGTIGQTDGYESGVYRSICTEPIRLFGEERYSNPRFKCARLRWAIMSQPGEENP